MDSLLCPECGCLEVVVYDNGTLNVKAADLWLILKLSDID